MRNLPNRPLRPEDFAEPAAGVDRRGNTLGISGPHAGPTVPPVSAPDLSKQKLDEPSTVGFQEKHLLTRLSFPSCDGAVFEAALKHVDIPPAHLPLLKRIFGRDVPDHEELAKFSATAPLLTMSETLQVGRGTMGLALRVDYNSSDRTRGKKPDAPLIRFEWAADAKGPSVHLDWSREPFVPDKRWDVAAKILGITRAEIDIDAEGLYRLSYEAASEPSADSQPRMTRREARALPAGNLSPNAISFFLTDFWKDKNETRLQALLGVVGLALPPSCFYVFRELPDERERFDSKLFASLKDDPRLLALKVERGYDGKGMQTQKIVLSEPKRGVSVMVDFHSLDGMSELSEYTESWANTDEEPRQIGATLIDVTWSRDVKSDAGWELADQCCSVFGAKPARENLGRTKRFAGNGDLHMNRGDVYITARIV